MQNHTRLYKNTTPITACSTTRLTPQFSRVSSAIQTPHRATISTHQKKRLTFQSTIKKASESPHITTHRIEEEGDRFVPNRGQTSASNCKGRFEFEGFKSGDAGGQGTEFRKDEHHRLLYRSLLDEPIKPKALFSFSGRKRQAQEGPFDHDSIRLVSTSTDDDSNKRAKLIRRQQEIPQKPCKILDAPELRADYYLHLLAWSKDDVLAVALDHTIYLRKNLSVTRLMSVRHDRSSTVYVTCLSWSDVERHYLAIASSCGRVFVYDTITSTCVRTIKHKRAPQGTPQDMTMVLSWNGRVLSVGTKAGLVVLWDVTRLAKPVLGAIAHRSTVCSLDWNADGCRLASGGNDNLVHIQDIRNLPGAYSTLRGHTAGVKALSWCPFKSETLVTGGGSEDRCIKIWKSNKLQESIVTDGQLTSFEWNPCRRELISATGFPFGKLDFWHFPTMERITELKIHGDRILYTAMSADHNTIVSGGNDELLAFWHVNAQRGAASCTDSSLFPACSIR